MRYHASCQGPGISIPFEHLNCVYTCEEVSITKCEDEELENLREFKRRSTSKFKQHIRFASFMDVND